MTSTNRILLVALLLGFAACDADKTSGTGGAGGSSSGGAGGKATGGNGGGGTGASGGAGGGMGGHPSASGGAGGNGGHGSGGAGGGGTAGGGGGSGGTASGGAGGGGGSVGGNGGNGSGGNGGQTGCVFSATYTLNDNGGLAPFVKKTILTPPAMFEYDHQNGPSGPTFTCTPALPACGSTTKIDVSDVEAAMANADVQAAFATATEPVYGERNVADGPAFEVARSTGGKFVVGVECTTASSTCTPTPAGVHTLVQLLHDLITQQTADPSCATN